jgi:hypothetical protein
LKIQRQIFELQINSIVRDSKEQNQPVRTGKLVEGAEK